MVEMLKFGNAFFAVICRNQVQVMTSKLLLKNPLIASKISVEELMTKCSYELVNCVRKQRVPVSILVSSYV